MKKRLGIQSLVEERSKEELVRFLTTRFPGNPALVTDFMVHFAAQFDLEENEFHRIIDRVEKLFPNRPSAMTHKNSKTIRGYINELIEQTRDCSSRENHRQAFIIVSHVLLLLDKYIDQIPEKYDFHPIQKKGYELLQDIYESSPAPSLKVRIKTFLRGIIKEGKAIPFDGNANPYSILLSKAEKERDNSIPFLSRNLKEKSRASKEHKSLFLHQLIRVLIVKEDYKAIIRLINQNENNGILYQAIHQYLPQESIDKKLSEHLRSIYQRGMDRKIDQLIYQILVQRNPQGEMIQELGVMEYFDSGKIKILDQLMEQWDMTANEMATFIQQHQSKSTKSRSALYNAYGHLGCIELLKDELLKEEDIFEIIPFLDLVYPDHEKEIKNKLDNLIRDYLHSHFGRPAIGYILKVLQEIDRKGFYQLHRFLIRNIRHTFGYRKHFQKLMKEEVE